MTIICKHKKQKPRNNLWSEGASSMMSSPLKEQSPMLTRLGDFIRRQRDVYFANKQHRHSRAGQLEWMMLCSEASDISTSTSESFLEQWEVKAFVPDCLLVGTRRRWRCEERGGKPRRWTSVATGSDTMAFWLVVCDFRRNGRTPAAGVCQIQADVSQASTMQGMVQVARRDAEALNGALMGGDDGSGSSKSSMRDRPWQSRLSGAACRRGRHRDARTWVRPCHPWWGGWEMISPRMASGRSLMRSGQDTSGSSKAGGDCWRFSLRGRARDLQWLLLQAQASSSWCWG